MTRPIELEGVHIYSGEEWMAMPPEIQRYARDRLDACGRFHAMLLGIRLRPECATKVVIDEIGRMVRVLSIHWPIDIVVDIDKLISGPARD